MAIDLFGNEIDKSVAVPQEGVGTRTFERRYQKYLRSAKWKAKRDGALRRANFKCQKCGAKERLEVHHLTYQHFEDERPDELLVVCPTCHKKEDRSREARTQWRRVDAWAAAKWGDEWHLRVSDLDAELQFEEWLKKNDYAY